MFSSCPTDPVARDLLLDNLSSALPVCEGPLSLNECYTALCGMAKNKTPGLDGLPMEFYVKFWSVLRSDLVSVLNSCYDSGCLSLNAEMLLLFPLRRVIVLIHVTGHRSLFLMWVTDLRRV